MRKDKLKKKRIRRSVSLLPRVSFKVQCKGIFAARRWAEIIDRKNEKTLKQKTKNNEKVVEKRNKKQLSKNIYVK